MNKHIIIADDNISVLVISKKLLEKAGYKVTTTRNSKETIKLISSETDLVISDYELGNENGLKLIMEIKKEYPNIKTILMSGNPTVKDQISDYQIDRFVRKPYETNNFIETVKEVLGGKKWKIAQFILE